MRRSPSLLLRAPQTPWIYVPAYTNYSLLSTCPSCILWFGRWCDSNESKAIHEAILDSSASSSLSPGPSARSVLLPVYLSSSPICVLLFIFTMSVLVQTPILPAPHQACFLKRRGVSQGQCSKTVPVRVPQETGSYLKVATEDTWMKDHLQSWRQTPGSNNGWRWSSPRQVVAGSYCHCWVPRDKRNHSSRTQNKLFFRKGISQLQLWPQVGPLANWASEEGVINFLSCLPSTLLLVPPLMNPTRSQRARDIFRGQPTWVRVEER